MLLLLERMNLVLVMGICVGFMVIGLRFSMCGRLCVICLVMCSL